MRKFVVPILAVMVLAYGCGSSTSSTSSTGTLSTALTSLSDVPNSSDMFAANTASANLSAKAEATPAVSGTAPILTTITEATADTYFWNGIVAAINAAGVATAAQISQFWGETEGGAGGEGACRMAQSVGYMMENIINGQTSLCYMKNMPNATSGVGIVSGTGITAANLFDRGATAKIVNVQVTDPVRGSENIFIRVYGSDTVGTTGYQTDLWFCETGATTAKHYELVDIDTSAGTLSTTSAGTETFGGSENTWLSTISGYLTTDASDNVIFDPTHDRTATHQFNSAMYGASKVTLTVSSANQITSKSYDIFTDPSGGSSCSNKVYALANFTGAALSDLRFTDAGYSGTSVCGGYTGTFSGGTEFQDTFYKATNTSTLATTAEAFVFADDSFFATAPATPTLGTDSYSCSVTPDAVVTMDMSDSVVAAIAATCEGERLENMNWCDSTDIQAARQIIFASEFGGP